MKLKANKIDFSTKSNGDMVVELIVKDYQDKRIMQHGFKELEDKEVSVEIKKYRNKRSIQQNRMLWELLTKLSTEINGNRNSNDVMLLYCNILEEANVESDFILALEKTESSLKNQYRAIRKRGTRMVETEKGDKIEMNLYQVWVGSSNYDTKQMTELMEIVIKHCAEYGIYTENM